MSQPPAAEGSSSVSWFPEAMLEPPSWRGDTLLPSEWVATEAAFADTGGLVSGDELAELIRTGNKGHVPPHAFQPISLVSRWIVAQRVVTIESPWGPLLPVFQFDFARAAVYPGVELALRELKDVFGGMDLALWFVTPNEWLGGARPVQGVSKHLVAVQQAARADRFVALGG